MAQHVGMVLRDARRTENPLPAGKAKVRMIDDSVFDADWYTIVTKKFMLSPLRRFITVDEAEKAEEAHEDVSSN